MLHVVFLHRLIVIYRYSMFFLYLTSRGWVITCCVKVNRMVRTWRKFHIKFDTMQYLKRHDGCVTEVIESLVDYLVFIWFLSTRTQLYSRWCINHSFLGSHPSTGTIAEPQLSLRLTYLICCLYIFSRKTLWAMVRKRRRRNFSITKSDWELWLTNGRTGGKKCRISCRYTKWPSNDERMSWSYEKQKGIRWELFDVG